MILYFTDSMGNRNVVAKDVADPAEALQKVLNHQTSRFIHQSGVCKIKTVSDKTFTFTTADDKSTGYTLEV